MIPDKKIKLEFDALTLRCLLASYARMRDGLIHDLKYEDTDGKDWWQITVFFAATELMTLRGKDKVPGQYKLKCSLAVAAGIRTLLDSAKPVDEWTNAELLRLIATIDAEIDPILHSLFINTSTQKNIDYGAHTLKIFGSME